MAEPKGSGQKTVNIGVFVPYISQLLDVAVVDVFGTMSHQYLSVLPGIPSVVASVAPHVNIYYVGSVAAGQPIELTSGMCMLCTHHLSDPAVAPGMLDLVVVPGVDPKLEKFDDDVVAWLAAQAACEETDILSVCTGIFLCGAAGILKGRKASGPRGPLQHEIRRRYEGVELVGDEYRWVRDGRIWSSGTVYLFFLPLFPPCVCVWTRLVNSMACGRRHYKRQ